jgi:hypothetical protein
MKPQILTKDVLLFKNAIEDPEKWMEIIHASKSGEDDILSNWEIWPPWGLGCKVQIHREYEAGFKKSTSDGKWLIEQSLEKFWEAITYYKNNTLNEDLFAKFQASRLLPESCEEERDMNRNIFGWCHADIAVYESIDTPQERPLSMEWHVDRRDNFGAVRHMLTFNLYPNDNYIGGEISFIDIEGGEKKVDSQGREYYLVDKPIMYKPEAGDALLFRTDVFHSVEQVVGNKFYIRQFLTAPHNQKYHDKRKEFKTEEDWLSYLAAIDKEELKGYPFQMLLYDNLHQVKWEHAEKRKICVLND